MELITERLILRDFTADDCPAVHAYQSKPLYLRYYEWTHRTPEDVQEFVGWFIAQQQQNPRYKFQFAVTLRDSGRLIGNAGVRKESAEVQVASMGYELDPAYWGQGYATEAARALVDYGFTVMQVHRIGAHCVADNTGSRHVLEKLGMRLEGRLRDAEYYKDRWWDKLLYGMLESEFTRLNL
jgi:[ribosomal protein S5]-alanine N-acetyltransferase